MSQLTAPTHTYEDKIPLWRRIREIMKEKGSSYSITAMSARLGMSRETLRLMLNGEREIYNFELEKIAQDLKVQLPRLLQEDLHAQNNNDLRRQLITQNQLGKAMELVEARHVVSIGMSERAFSLSAIAYICFWKQDFDKAKQYLQELYVIAEKIKQDYQDEALYSRCLVLFLNVYAHTDEFDKVLEIKEQVEPYLQNDPLNHGVLYVALAKMKYSSFEHKEAKMYLYKCLELYLTTTNRDRIGRAYLNVAWAEYADLNYRKARDLIAGSIEYWENEIVRLSGFKALAKVYIKLHEFQAAESIIRKTLQSEPIDQNLDLKARMLILLSRATQDTRYADGVARNLSYPKKSRYLAYRYLTIAFKQKEFLQQWHVLTRKSKGRLTKKRFPLDKNF
ncbi:hypothetical protein CIG75_11145 [Tumebacillus algifaecis]|uniref:HTH cro/C1-type domain-containing protein n=1 Tax=Tumebacillus algifaecis TaxID=1214604 RepID=A0A223D1F4_9BACL|nr:helix-turn-helix transcriptional regulator [Tumebacillus algifaecis]ASS75478.1 hypothetical protein CIG75_11145 [Tumebacillus algifaecis]